MVEMKAGDRNLDKSYKQKYIKCVGDEIWLCRRGWDSKLQIEIGNWHMSWNGATSVSVEVPDRVVHYRLN